MPSSSPVDRGVIWLAKACSTLVFLLAMQVVAPAAVLAVLPPGGRAGRRVWALVAALVLADAGIASLGALLAGAGLGEPRPGSAPLPVRFLPVAVPLVPARRAGDGRHDLPRKRARSRRLRSSGFSASHATIFALLGWALFEYAPRRTEPVATASRSARPDTGALFAIAAAVLMPVALALIFFYVRSDADQGYSQRIFYFHVPIALTTYTLFGWGAVNAARYMWTRDESLDLKSYVPMHLGVIFGSLTLVTGSIWAHVSWGVWWYWGSKQLTTFLIIFLFYCAYFMLRFSVEPGERRSTYSAVYTLLGVGLDPGLGAGGAARQELDPPNHLQLERCEHGRQHVPDVLRLAGRDALAGHRHVFRRDARQADRRADAPAADAGTGARRDRRRPPSSGWRPCTGIAWVAAIAYIAILHSKLGRLERQLDEVIALMERAPDG